MPTKPSITYEKSEENRVILAGMMKEFNLTLSKAAQLLILETGRHCSKRSISAWLAKSNVRSSRLCPDWVITTLKKALSRQEEVLRRDKND